ncbi:MAG: type II 3-dehydroquinate dehydratase [Desulfobacterales bacterium]|nr:type II 3-dehydroquinate dehydratase [Desulfobacterales bacterium]
MKILVIHGPNLNLLGTREPEHYGSLTLSEIDTYIRNRASELGMDAECIQSNSETAIVERIQSSDFDALIINPAAYTHTSVAIRDAISAVGKPTVEVHLSNIHKREEFRRHSYIAAVAVGQISGLGPQGYLLALEAVKSILEGSEAAG